MPVDYLLDNEVDVLITVPSTVLRVKTIMSKGIKKLDLKLLINCGEPLHLDVLDYSLKLLRRARFIISWKYRGCPLDIFSSLSPV